MIVGKETLLTFFQDNIVFLGVILLFILSFRKSEKCEEPLSRDTSSQLKGIAIAVVLLGHLAILVGAIKVPTTEYVAAHGVDIFLFLSAFGLMASFEKSGLKGFWKKRLLVLAVPYILFNLVRIPVFSLEGYEFTPLNYVLSLLGINVLFDPTMWYVQYIFVWYIIFYCIASIKNIRKNTVVIGISIASLVIIIINIILLMTNTLPKNPLVESWSHHLGFASGAIFYVIYSKIKNMPSVAYIIASILSLVVYVITSIKIPNIIEYTVANIAFVFFVVFLFMAITKMGLKSKLLIKLGELSYYIYLNELVVIMLVAINFGLNNNIGAVIILILTVILAYIIKIPSDFIVKRLK